MSGGSDSSSDRPAKGSGKDRRLQTRVRSRSLASGGVAANATHAAGSFLGTTVNLSIGGCLIRTYEALESGMDVSLRLELPEGALSAAGRIAHVNEDAVGCKMVGVQFVELAGDARARLVQHLATFGVEAGASDVHATSSGAGRFKIEGRVRAD